MQDTSETIYTELKELEAKIEQAGQNVHFSGVNAANKRAVYEELKNKALIEMYSEEATKGIKRTVDQRQAMYRSMYATQRLEWQLAENEWKASNDYLKALLGNQISVEVRLKILESDMRFAGRNAQAAQAFAHRLAALSKGIQTVNKRGIHVSLRLQGETSNRPFFKMTKKEYWEAHVKKNPSFSDEDKRIEISVGMLRKLMEEGYDRGFEHHAGLSNSLRDIFQKAGVKL